MDPRPYQLDAVERLRQALRRAPKGKKRVILESPTRSGKTLMGAIMVKSAVSKGKSVLWVVDRRELLKQASDRFWAEGIEHGIVLSGHEYQPHLVQIASKDTIWHWSFLSSKFNVAGFDLIIIDEGHISSGKTVWMIVEANPEAMVIALTATPAFPNQRGMGSHYYTIVKAITYSELKANGWIVPCTVWAPRPPDLSTVPRNEDGEFIYGRQLESIFNSKRLVGNAYEHWLKWGAGRQTVVFACGKLHAQNIASEFELNGVPAEYIDGETPSEGFSPSYLKKYGGGILKDNERDDILARFEAGHFSVLCNIDVLSKGWDCPPCSCCILARPTSSLVWFRQATARILTACPGKTEAVLIDMSGSVYEHDCFPDDDLDWPLDPDMTIREYNDAINGNQPKTNVCPVCLKLRRPGKKCSNCGHESKGRNPAESKLEHVDGELSRIERGNLKEKTSEVKELKLWRDLLGMCANTGRTVAQARAIFKSRTKHYPNSSLCSVPSHQWWSKVATIYPEMVSKKKDKATAASGSQE